MVSKVKAGFSLRENLGTPMNAAKTFLRLFLDPERSGRTGTLINTEEGMSRTVYQFEYNLG